MHDHGGHRFDPARAARLHDPARLEVLPAELLWRNAAVPDARVIVDIGAGTGLFAVEFARLAPSAVVYAADVSPVMLEWLTANLPPDVADRVRPVLTDGMSVPLPSLEADVVVMVALYHELDDAPAMLAEVLRLLRPGGRLLVVDWKKQATPDGPPMEIRVEPADIAAALSAAGFEDATADETSLADYAMVTGTRPTGG